MIWAALALSAFVIVVLSATLVAVALVSFKTSSSRDQTLVRVHDRNAAQLDGVLDRFMALDFSLFKAYQSVEGSPEGGWEQVEEDAPGEVEMEVPHGLWGTLTAPGYQEARAAADEEKILAEDFEA
jgi:hypothetical protein